MTHTTSRRSWITLLATIALCLTFALPASAQTGGADPGYDGVGDTSEACEGEGCATSWNELLIASGDDGTLLCIVLGLGGCITDPGSYSQERCESHLATIGGAAADPALMCPENPVASSGNHLPFVNEVPVCDEDDGSAEVTLTDAGWWDEGTWWGRARITTDTCGNVIGAEALIDCAIQDCVDEAAAAPIAARDADVAAFEPTVSTNPPEESVVHVPTWFWDTRPWEPLFSVDEHPVAPVTVVARAIPLHTEVDTGNGVLTCDGPGTPWSALAQADCTHEYTRPSITDEGEPTAHNIALRRVYHLSCTITTNGGGEFERPDGCSGQAESAAATHELAVVEVQSVNRD